MSPTHGSLSTLYFMPPLSDFPVLCGKIIAVAGITLLLRAGFWLVDMLLVKPLFDPLRHLPGPNGSLFQTHLNEVSDPTLSPATHATWVKTFGLTFRFQGFGKHDFRLMTFDCDAMSYIMNSSTFEKPWQTRSFLARLLGRGIFSLEGSAHRLQRRIIAPAFSNQSIKQAAPIFHQKAEELCNCFHSLISPVPGEKEAIKQEGEIPVGYLDPKVSSGVRIDVSHWISRASFDAMGLAAFKYDFHALEDESEGVYSAYRRLLRTADKGLDMRGILELYFPFLRKLFVSDDVRVTNSSLHVIKTAGKKLVHERKAEYFESLEHGIQNKDLLTLLIKANLSVEPSKRISDNDLLDQCSTFLLAGADNIAVALSWCIYLLSQHFDIQDHIRQEIRSIFGNRTEKEGCTKCNPPSRQAHEWAVECKCPSKGSLDVVERIEYLDWFVKESLRLCPPVHATIRVATKSDDIPVSHPITLSSGETIDVGRQGGLRIKKGTYVHIPIEGFCYSEEIWGKDALEFRPERWADVKKWDTSKPGQENLMTFGYGPHACPAYKFSVAEIKIFLVCLISAFRFRPVDDLTISKFNSLLTRPYVQGQWGAGSQLPVIVDKAE